LELPEGTFYVCETCREEVHADDPNVIRAIEQVPARGFGVGTKMIDGLGVHFHRECFPGGPAYRLDHNQT